MQNNVTHRIPAPTNVAVESSNYDVFICAAVGESQAPHRMMTNALGRSRDRSESVFKRVQRLLGPQVATPKNAAFVTLAAQALLITVLIFLLRSKDATILRLESTNGRDCQHEYGQPPASYNQPLKEAIDGANYDEMSPAITGIVETKKYTSFFGRFLRCKPVPCNIEHWPYIGDKCHYRPTPVKDRESHNASIWSLVQDDFIYTLDRDFGCPVDICRRSWRKEVKSTVNVTARAIMQHHENHSAWDIEMYRGNSYVRVNQYFGLEYQFSGTYKVTTIDEQGEEVVTNKTGSIQIHRGFWWKYCHIGLNDNVLPDTEPVYIIVPYTGRLDQLRLFYENVRHLLDEGVELRVIIATHGGAVHTLGATELLREMNIGLVEGELLDGHIVQVIESKSGVDGHFSRSQALKDGLEYAPAAALVFYCDVDMTIKRQFFDNCRYNTHRNYQVYYPVVYSLYPYGNTVSRDHGYWRSGAYGMVCAYKSDLEKNKKWMTTNRFKGWGMEDVELRVGFNNHWQISVFHAIEPNLLHRWHTKYCEWNSNIAACLGTVFQNLGSQRFLASIVTQAGIDVREIKYSPEPVSFDEYLNASNPASKNSSLTGSQAAESQTDQNKMNDLKTFYEESIKNGKAGLLSIFAQEAQVNLAEAFSAQRIAEHIAPRSAQPPSSGSRTEPQQPVPADAQSQGAAQGVGAGQAAVPVSDPRQGPPQPIEPVEEQPKPQPGQVAG